MRKKASGQVLIWALLFAVFVGALSAEPVGANPAVPPIEIQSPQNDPTYKDTTLPLYFTVETNNEYQYLTRYILNGQNPVAVHTGVIYRTTRAGQYGMEGANGAIIYYDFNYSRYVAQGKALLSDLSNGEYTLTVERYTEDPSAPQGIDIINSTSVNFTVNTASENAISPFFPVAPYPSLILDAPNNRTYWAIIGETADVQIIFYANLLPSWTGYSIDNQANITIPIYSGITDIPPGSKNLPLYHPKGDTLKLRFDAETKIGLGSHSFTLYIKDKQGNCVAQSLHLRVTRVEDYFAEFQD
jgi:hypothetical protein